MQYKTLFYLLRTCENCILSIWKPPPGSKGAWVVVIGPTGISPGLVGVTVKGDAVVATTSPGGR